MVSPVNFGFHETRGGEEGSEKKSDVFLELARLRAPEKNGVAQRIASYDGSLKLAVSKSVTRSMDPKLGRDLVWLQARSVHTDRTSWGTYHVETNAEKSNMRGEESCREFGSQVEGCIELANLKPLEKDKDADVIPHMPFHDGKFATESIEKTNKSGEGSFVHHGLKVEVCIELTTVRPAEKDVPTHKIDWAQTLDPNFINKSIEKTDGIGEGSNEDHGLEMVWPLWGDRVFRKAPR